MIPLRNSDYYSAFMLVGAVMVRKPRVEFEGAIYRGLRENTIKNTSSKKDFLNIIIILLLLKEVDILSPAKT